MGYERFTYIQGMKTYKEYTIDKNLVRKYTKFVENKICEDVENQGINVSDLINGVFVMLFSDQYIPIPQVVSFDESYTKLSLETRKRIQEILIEYSEKKLDGENKYGISAANFNMLDVIPTFYYLYMHPYFNMDSWKKEKIEYAFLYLLRRRLTRKEKRKLNKFHSAMCGENREIISILMQVDNEDLKENLKARNDLGYQLKRLNSDGRITKRFSKYVKKVNEDFTRKQPRDLLNNILDAATEELLFCSIGELYQDCRNDAITYNDIVSKYEDDAEKIGKKVTQQGRDSLVEKYTDGLRKYIVRNIFCEDEREEYYASKRGKGKISQKRSVSYTLKYILELVIISRENQKHKKNIMDAGEILDEEYDTFYDNLTLKRNQELKDIGGIIKEEDKKLFKDGYRYYLKYFVNDDERAKSLSVQKMVCSVKQYTDFVEKYFSGIEEEDYSIFSWFHYSSLFVAPWEFYKVAANVYSNRIEAESKMHFELSEKEYKEKFVEYCRELKEIKILSLQKELLENKEYFYAYIESPFWMGSIKIIMGLLKNVTEIIIADLFKINKEAYSMSDEELKMLHDMLCQFDFKNHITHYDNLEADMEKFMEVYLKEKNTTNKQGVLNIF